jgi:hypothetical protein
LIPFINQIDYTQKLDNQFYRISWGVGRLFALTIRLPSPRFETSPPPWRQRGPCTWSLPHADFYHPRMPRYPWQDFSTALIHTTRNSECKVKKLEVKQKSSEVLSPVYVNPWARAEQPKARLLKKATLAPESPRFRDRSVARLFGQERG